MRYFLFFVTCFALAACNDSQPGDLFSPNTGSGTGGSAGVGESGGFVGETGGFASAGGSSNSSSGGSSSVGGASNTSGGATSGGSANTGGIGSDGNADSGVTGGAPGTGGSGGGVSSGGGAPFDAGSTGGSSPVDASRADGAGTSDCGAGSYTGTLQGPYTVNMSTSQFVAALTFTVTAEGQVKGTLRGTSNPTGKATLVGTVDCSSGSTTIAIENGSYSNNQGGMFSYTGTMTATYDPGSGTFTNGKWTITEPRATAGGRGTWTAG